MCAQGSGLQLACEQLVADMIHAVSQIETNTESDADASSSSLAFVYTKAHELAARHTNPPKAVLV